MNVFKAFPTSQKNYFLRAVPCGFLAFLGLDMYIVESAKLLSLGAALISMIALFGGVAGTIDSIRLAFKIGHLVQITECAISLRAPGAKNSTEDTFGMNLDECVYCRLHTCKASRNQRRYKELYLVLSKDPFRLPPTLSAEELQELFVRKNALVLEASPHLMNALLPLLADSQRDRILADYRFWNGQSFSANN